MNVSQETFPFEIPADYNNPLGIIEIYFLSNIAPGIFHNPPFAILIEESIIDMAFGKLQVDLLVDMGVERSLVAMHEEVDGFQVGLRPQVV
jgi:hypothetical protein